MESNDDKYKGKVCFIRVRVMRHLSEIDKESTRDEWSCQPISRAGRDVVGALAMWAMPESMLTVAEVRAAVKGERKEDAK